MFDISIFANPARLKREFLATTDVAPQRMGPELQGEFDHLQFEASPRYMGGNFWWDFVRTYRRHLSWLTAGRSVSTVFVLLSVLASQWILDASNSLTASLWLLVFYTAAQLVVRVINAWTSRLQSELFICSRLFVTLRMNVKLLRMGQLASQDFSTGNLKTLISSDIYRIGDLFHGVSRNGLPCLLGLIMLGPVIVYYMGWPGVIAMVAAFGALPLSFLLSKYVNRKEGLIKAEEDALSTIIGEWVTNVRLLRFLGWEAVMRTRIASHVRTLVLEATKQHGVNLVNFGISVTWWLFPIIVLIWAHRALGGEQDLVTLFASIWMLNHITLYIRFLPDIFLSYAAASACVNRLNQLFRHRDIEDDLMPEDGGLTAGVRPVRMIFHDVGFQYAEGQPMVLAHLDLTLDLNQRVSIIGRVGAGKSTLLKLICAEIKPTSGVIEVVFDNGVRADLWRRDVYHCMRERLGYMPQEAYLSNASLAINVSLDTFHTERDVMHAIRMAELEADIGHWSHGIREEVGETGVNLSGGQKQRVNLARALYSGRPFLVLDDPLSAVDTDTEANLMQTLTHGPEGFVLSSHRLGELSRTDRLLVLERGRLVEDGSPVALSQDPHSEFSRQLAAGRSNDDRPLEDIGPASMQPVS